MYYVPKIIMIICNTVPEIWHIKDVIVIFHFVPFFALLPRLQPKKSKFWNNKKNAWRYHHLTYVYQKSWSDDVQFLRYGVWQMQLFFILSYFLPFHPLTAQVIKISKKWKKHLDISSFYAYVPKIMIRWCTVLKIWCTTDRPTVPHLKI